MTHTYIQAIKQSTFGCLTRSVRRRAATSKRRNLPSSHWNRLLVGTCLSRGLGRQAYVRKSSFKDHFEFYDVGTQYAGTIQHPAIHLEVTYTMLVDQRSKIF